MRSSDRVAPGRRLGHYDDLVADLVARAEQLELRGQPVGARWDIEGDPAAMDLVRLWGFVAEGVTAYTGLAAEESYLQTARDWIDLSWLAGQVGYRPRQRVAAEGWVTFDIDPAANAVVTAGTRVQASGTAEREAQTYEVVADTPLGPEWAGLTATWVPEPATPEGRTVRFLGDPGFRAGDDVLLLAEIPPEPDPPPTAWLAYWTWLIARLLGQAVPTTTPVAVVGVVGHEQQLGTTLVEFDRDVDGLLSDGSVPYAAYRVLDTASTARRLSKVLRLNPDGDPEQVNVDGYDNEATSATSVVLDRVIEDLSADRLVAVVDWSADGNRGDIVPVASHVPIDWEVTPGSSVRVSSLHFKESVGTLDQGAVPHTVYVLDRRVVATHYVFPASPPPSAGNRMQIRVHPAPSTSAPPSGRLAVRTTTGDSPSWEVLEVAAATRTESPDPRSNVRVGLLLDVVGAAPHGTVWFAAASGNVALVSHGVTASSALGSGDGITANRKLAVPESPVAAVVDTSGTPSSSLVVRVDGRRWTEVPTLFGSGASETFETRVGPEGEVEVRFGDGVDGMIPGSGADNIVATYRVGGGTVGEVSAGEIDTLLGSIRGVRSIIGAGPTAGGADQSREQQLRREAPTRARAMDRVVALTDLADVALAFPGVSHAVGWVGAGPAALGCPPGPHVAVLRHGSSGVREALPAEVDAVSMYLDARRDITVPLCVVSAEVVPVTMAVTVTVDPALDPSEVSAKVFAAILDPDGVLASERRDLGQPLDRSDVAAVTHGVEGVVGIDTLDLSTPTASASGSSIGRLPADRHALLVVTAVDVRVVLP